MMNIGTLTGRVEDIMDLMDERRVDVLGLSEIKWRGSSMSKVEEEEVVMILAHPEAPLLAMGPLPDMDPRQGSEAEVLAHADLPLGVLLLHTLEGLVDLASGDRPHLITGDQCLLQECTLPTT
uniref:Uncharacterized protein n=1 Tax=Timema cristinae TaxID=61476 RepID=A0A7R9GPC6_TIMCR|nr:unnamed protein product [Timema cristinae]